MHTLELHLARFVGDAFHGDVDLINYTQQAPDPVHRLRPRGLSGRRYGRGIPGQEDGRPIFRLEHPHSVGAAPGLPPFQLPARLGLAGRERHHRPGPDLHVADAVASLHFYREEEGTSSYRVLEVCGTLHVIRQPSPWSLTAGLGERLKDFFTSLLLGQ
jgi:hypothetical protein